MQAAGDDQSEKDACLVNAAQIIKEGNLAGRAHDPREVKEFLKEAARSKAAEVRELCTDTEEACKLKVREAMALVLGKAAGQVNNQHGQSATREGAFQAMILSTESCVQAKTDDASATCDDPCTTYKETTKDAKPPQCCQLKMDTFKHYRKGLQKLCTDSDVTPTEDELKACKADFQDNSEALVLELLSGCDTDGKLAARKERAEKKATNNVLGKQLGSCLEEAVSCIEAGCNSAPNYAVKLAACTTELDAARVAAGVTQAVPEVLKVYRADALAECATVCSATEREACMASCRRSMVVSGMTERTYNMIRKIATFTATAEASATCMQGPLTPPATDLATQCEAIAKEEFQAVSGSVDDAAWATVKAKVTKLATAIQNGEEVVMKKKLQLLIAALTGGTSCDVALLEDLLTLVRSLTTTPAISGSKLGSCEMVDGKAEYSVLVGIATFTDDQIETVADAINSGVEYSGELPPTRRLLLDEVRRLVKVRTVYTAQETEACGSSDTACGETDPALTGSTPTTGDAATSSQTSDALQRAGISVLMTLAMITSALM